MVLETFSFFFRRELWIEDKVHLKGVDIPNLWMIGDFDWSKATRLGRGGTCSLSGFWERYT